MEFLTEGLVGKDVTRQCQQASFTALDDVTSVISILPQDRIREFLGGKIDRSSAIRTEYKFIADPKGPGFIMTAISTKNSVVEFAGGQAGSPLFSRDMNLAPLTNGKSLGSGWDDISTGLSFVLAPRRLADDGFKGARLFLIYPAVDKGKIVGGCDLHLISSHYEDSGKNIYRVSYENYLDNAGWNKRSDLGELRELINSLGGDGVFFEYCLSMATACHTVLLQVKVNESGQDVLVVHDDVGAVEFQRS